MYNKWDCLFKIDVEGYENNYFEHIMANPPSELSLSLHKNILRDPKLNESAKILRTVFSKCLDFDNGTMTYCYR